jgi:LysR family glycine cleavage system transcriptional activator
MQRLRTRLPPVNALVAFEAAARHTSFTEAARELGVTREAVSRQIRILETHLGVKLFIRRHRAIELSASGREFNLTVHRALEDIAAATLSLSKAAQSPKVAVTATVAIASYWLTPRLPRFRRLHPDVEIRVVVSDTPPELSHDSIDIGLQYGDGAWPGCESVRLFGCDSFPVCSETYLRSAQPIETESDLIQHPLLNLDGSVHEMENWHWWLNGIEGTQVEMHTLDVVGFDNYANVLQAALDGQGIALGFSGIIDELLKSKQLVRPVALARSPGRAVYVVRASDNKTSAAAAQFHAWVLAEASVEA